MTTAVDLRDARKQLDGLLPDLVLLDVRLPDGNGIAFCRQLKNNPVLDDVVVVLISSEEISTESKAEGLDAGANDYLVRPMPKREFMARINRQIRLQQMRKCLTQAQAELERRVKERTQQLLTANAELRREIEERRRAEVSLRESEDRFRVLAENARDLICLIDPRGRYEYVSPSYTAILGYSLPQVRAMNPLDLVHPEDLALAGHWRDCPALEFRVRKADGSWVWMEGCSYPVTWQGAAYTVGVMREITERKRAEELLRALPQQILEAQEAERRRVSRDLHDSVNQILASVRFRVDTLEEVTASARPVVRETLGKAKELLENAMQEVRRISRDLRPGELDDLGLVRPCAGPSRSSPCARACGWISSPTVSPTACRRRWSCTSIASCRRRWAMWSATPPPRRCAFISPAGGTECGSTFRTMGAACRRPARTRPRPDANRGSGY